MGCDNNDCDTGIWERTSKAPVQTRLTAEQMWPTWQPTKLGSMSEISVPRSVVFQFAEAFRDKSEAGLREEIKQLKLIYGLVERDEDWPDRSTATQLWRNRAIKAEAEVAALRERERLAVEKLKLLAVNGDCCCDHADDDCCVEAVPGECATCEYADIAKKLKALSAAPERP